MLITLTSAPGGAQSRWPGWLLHRDRHFPQAEGISSPFATDMPASTAMQGLRFLAPHAISAHDREALDEAMPAIERKAAVAGFNLREGNWSYEQIACSLYANDVLLLYSLDRGPRDQSRFSVVIPRDSKSAVRVVPILRRSFTPYTSAPGNPVTIAAFNSLRENSPSTQKPDWLLTGRCYAALAGARVQLNSPESGSAGDLQVAMPSVLKIDEGKNVVQFVDVEQPRNPQQWRLIFDPKGKLVKVEVSTFPALQVKIVP